MSEKCKSLSKTTEIAQELSTFLNLNKRFPECTNVEFRDNKNLIKVTWYGPLPGKPYSPTIYQLTIGGMEGKKIKVAEPKKCGSADKKFHQCVGETQTLRPISLINFQSAVQFLKERLPKK